MLSVTYLATTNAAGVVRVLRIGDAPGPAGDAAPFPMEVHDRTLEAARQLGWLLLYDCLGNDRRADRLQVLFTDLLVGPLLHRNQWALSCEEIEDAVQSIEFAEGWFWLDAGCYADEEAARNVSTAEEEDEPLRS